MKGAVRRESSCIIILRERKYSTTVQIELRGNSLRRNSFTLPGLPGRANPPSRETAAVRISLKIANAQRSSTPT